MQALYQEQAHRASVFVAANQDRVATVTDTAVKMANDLLGRLASKILPQNSIDNLQALVSPSKIEALGPWLRQHAVQFIHARASGAFWELIDGLSALTDATGAHWPYMTEEVRSVRLKHALEHFECCEHLLEVETAKICA